MSRPEEPPIAYSLKPEDHSVEMGLHRIADSQIDKAMQELDDPDLPIAKRIHQVRKRCKKLRGLFRLYRQSFPDYADENQAFRDAARLLSDLRDADAILDILDDVIERYEEEIGRDRLKPLRQEMERQSAALRDRIDFYDRRDEVRLALVAALERMQNWTVADEGFDALADGLKKTYKRARNWAFEIEPGAAPEDFHQWRKRVKYHGYHARLLKRIWPDMMKPHVEIAGTLADRLGDQHDLVVLARRIANADFDDGEHSRAMLDDFIERERIAIEAEVVPLGRKLFAEKPDALVDRWRAYWEAWRAGA